jgi:hypothetical protein
MAVRPATYNIPLQRRADYGLPLQFKGSNGLPLNFTGWNAYAQVWNKARTIKYADFLVVFPDRVNGMIKISLSDEQTEAIPDEAFYDMLLENPSGEREYYMEGMIYVSEGYTKPVTP